MPLDSWTGVKTVEGLRNVEALTSHVRGFIRDNFGTLCGEDHSSLTNYWSSLWCKWDWVLDAVWTGRFLSFCWDSQWAALVECKVSAPGSFRCLWTCLTWDQLPWFQSVNLSYRLHRLRRLQKGSFPNCKERKLNFERLSRRCEVLKLWEPP